METKIQKIISAIEAENGELFESDKEDIRLACAFHWYEPMALAEVIERDYNVPYKTIIDIL